MSCVTHVKACVHISILVRITSLSIFVNTTE
uniref:Uncharacterized protein n=1 Tax=Anguilla anguilla TaxID=7936 RepID=A0A0E9XR99_ANGAN